MPKYKIEMQLTEHLVVEADNEGLAIAAAYDDLDNYLYHIPPQASDFSVTRTTKDDDTTNDLI